VNEETIAVYDDIGGTYEIDHLGINYPETQWGNFAVYHDGEMVAEFCIPESSLKLEYRPAELPVTTGELIDLARGAVAGDYASDEDVAAYLELQGMIGRHLPSPN
jgi:hypothetical protein